MSKDVNYPFKTYENILERDCPSFPACTLEEFHHAIERISISDNVPLEVRQIFETAKNACLYSYFAYRLNELAEQYSLTALEKALKLRAEKDAPDMFVTKDGKSIDPSFNNLIDKAIKMRWFNVSDDNELNALKESLHAGRKIIRNNVAHGDAIMMGGGVQALTHQAAIISLLYSDQ